jgi:fructose-1,6-bisphosphatase/inositol monophosphatase family enzyme
VSGTAQPADDELTRLAGTIAARVRERLRRRLQDRGGGESLHHAGNLKSTHEIDDEAGTIARESFDAWRCNVVIEGEAVPGSDADFCVYIDPVDGSLNWDRGTGDPAFVLAVAAGPVAGCLDDLSFAYVEGLRSGDTYRTEGGCAVYRAALAGREHRLRTAAPDRIEEATGYLRAGYGGARRQLARTLPLYLGARDLRASDNAAIEFGEIARNAAHFMVEARSLSDGFNLLAWPIVRAAGGALRSLDGADLPPGPFDPNACTDYVLAGSRTLAEDVLQRMRAFDARGRAELEALMGRIG